MQIHVYFTYLLRCVVRQLACVNHVVTKFGKETSLVQSHGYRSLLQCVSIQSLWSAVYNSLCIGCLCSKAVETEEMQIIDAAGTTAAGAAAADDDDYAWVFNMQMLKYSVTLNVSLI